MFDVYEVIMEHVIHVIQITCICYRTVVAFSYNLKPPLESSVL